MVIARRLNHFPNGPSPEPDYRIPASYIYVNFLTDSQIAWEYLRRNEEYRQDYFEGANFYEANKRYEDEELIASSLPISEVKKLYDAHEQERQTISNLPIKWGLKLLEHPDVRADDEASIEWEAEENPSVVEYVIAHKPNWRGKARSFTDLKGKIQVIIDHDGYHLTVHHRGEEIRFHGKQSPFLKPGEVLELVDNPDISKTRNQYIKHRANRIFRDAPHPAPKKPFDLYAILKV